MRRPEASQRGYTIIELLAVTAIIVIVSGLITGVLYSSLRGGNKARITNEVAQGGNFALSVISNTIISSEDVTSVGGALINDCTTERSGTSITLKQSSGAIIQFACESDTISSNSASLIDTSILRVDSSSCAFICRQEAQDSYSLPIIEIKFTVSQKGSAGLVENAASTVFGTSVSMRNYNPK